MGNISKHFGQSLISVPHLWVHCDHKIHRSVLHSVCYSKGTNLFASVTFSSTAKECRNKKIDTQRCKHPCISLFSFRKKASILSLGQISTYSLGNLIEFRKPRLFPKADLSTERFRWQILHWDASYQKQKSFQWVKSSMHTPGEHSTLLLHTINLFKAELQNCRERY